MKDILKKLIGENDGIVLPIPEPPTRPMRPEDVLLAWILWLPEGVDPAEAALQELCRPELRGPTHPHLKRLASLLQKIAALTGGTAIQDIAARDTRLRGRLR